MAETINVLLVGAGAREHALAWRMKRSPSLGRLFVTGTENPGLRGLGEPVDAPADVKEVYRLRQFCEREKIGLVVVGPEDPLAQGMTDGLRTRDRAVFGPDKAGARLEADKAWAKRLMRAASIPTADSRVFTDAREAVEYLRSREEPHVVKAAGLAKGKGVIVPSTIDEACEAVERIMVQRVFGDAGDTVVIEERLQGTEASVLALTDGRTAHLLEPCQDYKRLRDGDEGPNTGGMGAYTPTTAVDDATMDFVQREVIVPLLDALRREEIDYRGVIYAGLMLTHGGPKVLEFNVRFGDPECQPLMVRFQGDLVRTLHRAATRRLDDATFGFDERPACCVVLASKGYPDKPETGFPIEGLDEAAAMEGVTVFHAGTKRGRDGKIVTSGGRVLSVTGTGETLSEARSRALRACDAIRFEGKQHRTDIALAAVEAAS